MKDSENSRLLCRGGGVFTIVIFLAVMIFFFLLGLMLPLRPTESVLEKRELKEFPAADAESVMDGTYFSELSEWYSDSFPLRDVWMSWNDRLKSLYGFQTTQIIQGNTNGKDEIPDIAALPSRASEEETDTEVLTSEETEETEEETEETEVPTTMAPITAQVQNSLFIHEDTAYGIYYFNQQAADIFLAAINRTAQNLQGQAQVYCMLVPISSTFYLSEETLRSTDGSDELKAMEYYYGSLDPLISKVDIYDILNEHKDEYIYFRTDHHWNGRGAYYAYRKWAEVKGITPHEMEEYTREEFPGFLGTYYASSKSPLMESNPDTVEAFRPLTCTTLTLTQSDGLQLDWPIINEVGSYTCFAGSDNPFSVIHNPNVANGESCVVIKESYANALIPFLADHYETIYWFDYRSYNGDITSFIRENGVNDVIFVNGTEPMSSVQSMERLSGLLP